MEFATIAATAAPAPVARNQRSAQFEELRAAVANLKEGEALRITPDAGKSLRGLSTSVGKAINQLNLGDKVESYAAEGAVFVTFN